MARNRNRRVIYDNDATVVTETAGTNDSVEVVARSEDNMAKTRKSASNKSVDMPLPDVIDTFAAYLLPRFKITKDNSQPGHCLICGKDTAYPIRKLCVDCMDKYSDEVYSLAREASENGNTSITLNT